MAFFVLSGSVILAIPKTIEFVKKLDEWVRLVNHLHKLLLIYIKKDKERIIRIFISILKSDTKTKYLKDFYYDDIKI